MYISLATTEVSYCPAVIVRTMSKTFSVPMVMVVTTTISEPRMVGMVTLRNCCHALAPSMRAAS